MKQQSKTVDEEIQAMVVKVINALDLLQSERQLVAKDDAVFAGKSSVLSQQKQSAQILK